ncbi:MAG: glycosyltransferase [Campylobacteraceae bacterium]|jgi:capsular polysaccharide export protein|nr:glycosyltransferase [Campylobacteraceae bacterium]
MSLQAGNEYLKKGLYGKAIEEYKKIDKNSPLYRQAEFNIKIIENRKNIAINLPQKQINENISNDILQREHETSNIKVSIIIPVYNVEPYLRQCLDSVINQTLKEIEIICVDDGSTDKSFDMLNEYAVKDSRFIIIKQKNSGAAIARNMALKIMKGEYFVFMDPDDFYPNNNVLNKLYDTVKERNVLVCGGSLLKYDNNGNKIKNSDKNTIFSDNILIYYIDYQYCFSYQRFIFNTKILKDNNLLFPILKRFQDPPFFIEYMAIAKQFYAISESVYCYRCTNRGVSLYDAQATLDLLKGIQKCIELSKKYCYEKLYNEMIEKLNKKYVISVINKSIDKQEIEIQLRETLFAIETKKTFMIDVFYEKYLYFYKISLIIPVYNVEKYLPKCLDSAINQTLKDIEIICVNDGSTDGSLDILRKYEKKDNRIIIIDQKNGGLSASRNAGLDIAKAPYIMFIDSDDWIESDTLKVHYETMVKEKADVIIGNFIAVPESEADIKRHNNYVKYYSSLEKPEGKYEFTGNFKDYRSSSCCKLYKKEIIDKYNLRFPTSLINEDEAWHWYYFSHIKSIYCLEKAYYNRLVRSNSIMSNREIHGIGILDMLYILEHIFNYLVKQDLYNKYKEQYIEYFKKNKKAILGRCSKDLSLRHQAEKKLNKLENEFLNQPPINIFSDKYYIFSKEAVISKLVSSTLPYLFDDPSKLQIYENIKKLPTIAFLWGSGDWYPQKETAQYAIKHNMPLLKLEDGFLRSADTWCNNTIPKKYTDGISFTVTDSVHYFDATQPSRLEQLLNDKNIIITEPRKSRARKCIDKIVQNYLTKYNHQPIFAPKIGRDSVKKILVVDQSYGDFSISKGLANDKTFQQMLDAAIKENPNADIIVKTHPDTIATSTTRKTGYYSGLTPRNNIYIINEPINPISLIQCCDKVYVCTTQLGFEALMCGKEVHVFGMPFYAGWGLTYDRQICKRRMHTRSIEELFYIAYIIYSYYVNPKTQTRCEIEDAIKYLIELRDEYNSFKKERITIFDKIENIFKNRVLADITLKYNLRIWNGMMIVIDIIDFNIAFDIIPNQENITVNVVLRKNGDRDMISKLYYPFPTNKDRKTIFVIPKTLFETSLIDFMKKEISKIIHEKLYGNNSKAV